MPKLLRTGLSALLLCSILVVICYWFVDKPVVYFVDNNHISEYLFLKWATYISDSKSISILLLCVYPILVIRFCYGKYGYTERTFLIGANSVIITYILRFPLKVIFGRYWPATWVHNNPSLLNNGAYGFNWFKQGAAYTAFPSGHTALIMAAMTVLWIANPRWRWLAIILVSFVIFGLVGMNYHFISDIIAGAFLGWVVAYYAINIAGLIPASKLRP